MRVKIFTYSADNCFFFGEKIEGKWMYELEKLKVWRSFCCSVLLQNCKLSLTDSIVFSSFLHSLPCLTKRQSFLDMYYNAVVIELKLFIPLLIMIWLDW